MLKIVVLLVLLVKTYATTVTIIPGYPSYITSFTCNDPVDINLSFKSDNGGVSFLAKDIAECKTSTTHYIELSVINMVSYSGHLQGNANVCYVITNNNLIQSTTVTYDITCAVVSSLINIWISLSILGGLILLSIYPCYWVYKKCKSRDAHPHTQLVEYPKV